MKYLHSFLILFFSVAVGFTISKMQRYDAGGGSPVALNEAETSRAPASIKTPNDFSGLQGEPLVQAIKKRLLAETRVVSEKSDRGVVFGDFTVQGPNGQPVFACKQYPKIKMSFVGDGAASSGELPQMEVEGDCTVSSDINLMAPVWIPVGQILSQPVAEGYFNFNEGDKVKKVSFMNLGAQWPKRWFLKSVELTGDNKNIFINANELSSRELITIDFQ